ncbi:MAG TPA: MarR family transcriptional regulator [Firmicutes bacterium]|nr:MarR family transcriptional regulator [Bacillota bacterium]
MPCGYHGNNMDQRFLDALHRSNSIWNGGGDQEKTEQSQKFVHQTKKYLAVLHQMQTVCLRMEGEGILPRGEQAAVMAIGNHMDHPKGIRASSLGRELGISNAAVSKVLNTLEKKYLIRRIGDEQDRRVVWIQLTEQGTELYNKAIEEQDAFLKRIFLRMGEEDLETFLTLWEKFNKITEEESGVTTDIVKMRRDDMKTVFIEDCKFSFSAADVLERMGMPRNHNFGEQIQELMEKAAPIAKPKAFFMEVPIESRTENSVTIGGQTFYSVALAKNLSKVDTVYPFLCTCGKELADYAKTLDDMMSQYAFDAIMEFYRKQVTIDLTEALSNHLAEGGQTSAVNPGSLVDWPVSEQKKLFAVFGENAEKTGVTLTDSCLMFPVKTVSGIRYATDKAFHNCELCQRKNCPNREAPFNKELYLKTLHD